VLGATGSVGQRFVALLAEHPWFELAHLAASERSAGRAYGEVVRWCLPDPVPARARGMRVATLEEEHGCRLVFSALEAGVAGPVERAEAARGRLVVSNTRTHRMEPDVPLLVPEINPGHLALLERQSPRGGGLVTNPNCSTIGVCLALAPLARRFGLRRAHVVTLQALSGAGLEGPSALSMLDNLIPFIAGEEEKLESETLKILGSLEAGGVRPAEIAVSAACNRVGVLDGHTACVSIELARPASAEELLAAWEGFRGPPQELGLPSAPARPLVYLAAPDAPQPRLHRELERGMAAVLGRLRPCPLLGWKFVVLSPNTLRGAAGGALLCAELAVAEGRLPRA
jgi:aspartate-semialdehyde dehydrogenase